MRCYPVSFKQVLQLFDRTNECALNKSFVGCARALAHYSMCFTVSDLKIDLFLNFSLDKSLVFTQNFIRIHMRGSLVCLLFAI